MSDFLDLLAQDARKTVASGYYVYPSKYVTQHLSLRNAILNSQHVPVIAEVKGASPSAGVIKEAYDSGGIALAMARGGAVGISVLTEPKHFNGSLSDLAAVRKAVDLPLLMKDIIVSPLQLDAAAKIGANAVLLIQSVYDRMYCEFTSAEMIEQAHIRQLEVLLEVHSEDEFRRASASNTDLIGINNRNLATLQVDINTTKRILEKRSACSKIVLSESGISTPDDVRTLLECGVDAFLIGSAIMSADDVEAKVKDLTMTVQTR